MAIAEPPLAPPHDLEAEQSVLGAIFLSDVSLYGLVIQDGLRPQDFYREQHRIVYQAMMDLYNASEPVDIVTVKNRLREAGRLDDVGGEAGVESLAGMVPAAGNLRHYARIVRDHALLRSLLTTTMEIQASVLSHEAAPRDLVERAEKAMLEVGHDERQKEFRSIHDVLDTELEKLHRLSQDQTALTGVRSGYTKLDELTGGFQNGNLVVIAARPSMGKCLTGDALVYDPRTGARRRLDAVVEAVECGERAEVAALGADLRLHARAVRGAMRSGVQPVFRLTTRLGRTLEATANHPLLTIGGWRELGELAPGARIAVPRSLPRSDTPAHMPDAEIVLLAALIADGNVTQRTPRFTFGANAPVADEVRRAAHALGVAFKVPERGWGTAYLSAGRGAPANPVTDLCKRHGIWGKAARDKHIPDAVFGLSDDQVARFLSVLFACDGYIHVTTRLRHVGYCTISERLAHDVQHLLLRLGVVGRIRTLRRNVYEGTGTVAREVLVTAQDSLWRFAEAVPVCGKEDRVDRLRAGLATVADRAICDSVPVEAWDRVLAAKGTRTWSDVNRGAARQRSHNWHVGTRPLSRGTLVELATVLGDDGLFDLATSDLWWDEVASIEPIGERDTFDLEIDGDHNFVADDVVVHNSALVTNMAENAAIQHGVGVALFSLEMSEAELAQRFIASQANIKGEELRKGRVDERRWPKILQACQRLSDAPLYIDDSSGTGLLEIRAKARRLASQQDLGLIIVDYLQLMHADERVESRVEQVSQMSRGLKLLARELDVPVIALSQLNRGVEARTDKRPILSDLRESGAIEQDSDLVMFIYRDEYYNPEETEEPGIAELIIAKHRNGPIDRVKLVFRSEFPKFMNLLPEDRAPL